ncbi:HDIG domain-containing protein [bacterium]|nr:HDIG domain-containing protein [bacterium]
MMKWFRINPSKHTRNLRALPEKYGQWIRLIITFGLIVLLVLMFPRGNTPQFAAMKEGAISARRIVAPFSFEILKTEDEYNRDRQQAAAKVVPVYRRMADTFDEVSGDVDSFFRKIYEARFNVQQESVDIESIVDSLFSSYSISVLSEADRKVLIYSSGQIVHDQITRTQAVISNIIQDFTAIGILDTDRPEPAELSRIYIPGDPEPNIRPAEDYFILTEAKLAAGDRLRSNEAEHYILTQLGFRVIDLFLRPTIFFDEVETQRRIDAEMARVPMSSGFVYENEKIVGENERITPEIRKELGSLAAKMAEMGMETSGLRRLLPLFGRILFVAIVLFMLGVFIYLDKPSILYETKSFLLIALILLLISMIAFFLHKTESSEYLIPIAMGGMLFALLFDAKLGFAGTAVMSLLVGGLWGNNYNVVLISFVAGVVGVLTTLRVRNRSRLIHSILIMIATYFILIGVMAMLHLDPINVVAKEWSFGALNGLLVSIITFGLLPLIESAFGITTDYSLLELSNFNHPLLKKLSMKASGTYHHSIIVGNLSEAAAHAVGANSLLARTGSYYHDIGKTEKSEYFVENQNPGENPHVKLTPRMSALILMNHVKKGMEMAVQYRLPRDIKDIIQQHQGTTIMNFFYNKALEKDNSGGVSMEDYRYPGPIPQSKESAIVMLADVVEAASRTLKTPTHSRLKGLIGELVDGRFKEGQLDQSPLTLRDLDKIKESFLTILAGTFHTRIEYPDKTEPVKLKVAGRENGND